MQTTIKENTLGFADKKTPIGLNYKAEADKYNVSFADTRRCKTKSGNTTASFTGNGNSCFTAYELVICSSSYIITKRYFPPITDDKESPIC